MIALRGDAREPEVILRHPAVRGLLRPAEPTGLLMTAVLHFVADAYDPPDIVARYLDVLAPASCVAISHGTADHISDEAAEEGVRIYGASEHPIYLRSREQVRMLFAGLELVPPWQDAKPDVVAPRDWLGPDLPRPRGQHHERPEHGAVLWCGVGRKTP